METAESLGFIQYWGSSEWFNLLKNRQLEKREYKIFVSAGSDIRHVFKTCLDNFDQKDVQLTFYIHEKNKEPFARSLLFLLIMHTVNLSFRERTDLFLELFGNASIRDKASNYIDKVIPYLDNLISNEKKYTSALNEIVDLKELKFKDRDDLVDIARSWYSSVPFQMDKLRDQRLRYHYKARYDFRTNLIDWDYQMNLKEYAPIIHFFHYREWRQSGVAFESRFSTYPTPNRTLSSYLPGKKKATNESCLVRGYWGDIIVSPYLSYGIQTDVMPEKEKVFKIVNMQQVSHSVAVSEFNVQHMIQKFDNLSDFHLEFDEPKKEEEKKKDEQLEKIEEQDEAKEQDDEQEIPESKDQQEKQDSKENQQEEPLQYEKKTEGEIVISKEPLIVFKNLSLKIFPIFDEMEKIYNRSKFNGFFDVGFLGFFNSANMKNQEMKKMFAKDAVLYCENARYLVPIKIEDRKIAYDNIIKVGTDAGWKLCEKQDSEALIAFKMNT